MSVGMLGYIAVGVESSGAGTSAFSVTPVDFIPFISETLAVTRNDIDDQSIMSRWDQIKVYNGLQSVGGNITAQVHPSVTGYMLLSCFDATTATKGFVAGAARSHAQVFEHRFVTQQTQFQAGSGSDTPGLTFHVYRGPSIGAGSAFAYYNCTGNTMEFTVEAGQLARMSFDFLGRDFSRVAQIAQASRTYQTHDAFLWSQVSVSLGGGGSAIFESLTVRLNNNLEAVPLLDGRTRPGLIKRNNFRTVDVNGSLSFQTDSEYDRFFAGSESQLVVTFQGDVPISAGPTNNNMLQIDVPKMRYSTFPINIGGPGRIQIGFTGRGVFDQTSNYALQVTLVNTRTNAYTVNSTD